MWTILSFRYTCADSSKKVQNGFGDNNLLNIPIPNSDKQPDRLGNIPLSIPASS